MEHQNSYKQTIIDWDMANRIIMRGLILPTDPARYDNAELLNLAVDRNKHIVAVKQIESIIYEKAKQ